MIPHAPWNEKHYSTTEVAELFGLSADTVRGIFSEVSGVLKIQQPRSNKRARPYVTLRIPSSILEAWHRDNSRGWADEVQGVRRRVQKPLVGRDKRSVVALGGLDRGVTK